jgi:hypothetical protein
MTAPGTNELLSRIAQLLAGLPGPYGNEHLWTLVHALDDGDDPADQVFAFLRDRGVIDSANRFGDAAQAPQNTVQLRPLLRQVDQREAIEVLVGMTSTTLAYRVAGRYAADRARQVFDQLARLLGWQSRWWTNTDLTSWHPVTRHTMDALVIGAGRKLSSQVRQNLAGGLGSW